MGSVYNYNYFVDVHEKLHHLKHVSDVLVLQVVMVLRVCQQE